MRHFFQREAVGLAETENDRVLGHRRLQLEVELAAEALAQAQSPGAVDAAAERAVHDQLHAAGFVEEALQDNGVLGGQLPEHTLGAGQIFGELVCGAVVEMQLLHQPFDRGGETVGADLRQARIERGAQARDRV